MEREAEGVDFEKGGGSTSTPNLAEPKGTNVSAWLCVQAPEVIASMATRTLASEWWNVKSGDGRH